MGFLELARVMLKFGMALLECVGVVGEGAGVVDVAEAAAAEAGIGAAVDIATVTKARAASRKAAVKSPRTATMEAAKAATMKAAKTTTVETAKAAAMEASEAATRDGAFGADREAAAIAAPASSATASFLLVGRIAWSSTFSRLLFDAMPAALSRTGSSSVPGGTSGANTGSAMRGAKSQSVKTAVNCGCAGCVLVGDHQLAGRQLRPVFDPDLPVDVLLDKGERTAGPAVHVVLTQIEPVLHIPAHGLVGIAVEKVGERRGEVQFRYQLCPACCRSRAVAASLA